MRDDPAEIFADALAHAPDERAAFVATATRGDAALRERVEELLAAHLAAARFLAEPLVARQERGLEPQEMRPASGPGQQAVVTETVGDRIGPYVLRECLGEGGFGVVYRAEQIEPVQREVALKVIKLGMDTREVIRRFEHERRALALTEHPNIARVLDAGATGTGRPYFVMELVRGEDICSWCDRRQASIETRLRLFGDVCRAVQHAHDRGLVHRDLKPQNVLVTETDGRPTPKVIDFGVAKASHSLKEHSRWTGPGLAIGTPAYMSPEQASLGKQEIDARSDIYSLGVLLYELLTGTTPIPAERLAQASPAEIERALFLEPVLRPAVVARAPGGLALARARARALTPAALAARLRGDVEWILLRALEKDRDRRYASARELAEDLDRHLEHKPVIARAPSRAYRLARFVARHRVAAAGVLASATALGAGSALATHAYLRSAARSVFVQELLEGAIPHRDLPARARAAFGQEHAAVAEALGQAAERAGEEGELAAATELLQESLAAWRLRHGQDHPRVARAYGRLAAAEHLAGNLAPAEEHYRVALSILQRSEAGAGLGIAEREGLARLVRLRGDLDEASRLLREAVELRRKLLPERRAALAEALSELWDVLRSAGREEEAIAIYRDRIAATRAAYPAESLASADELLGFGVSLRSLGRRAEAERMLREGLDLYRRHGFPPGDGFLAGVLALASLVESDGPATEVDRLLAEAEEVGRRLHDPRSLELAKILERRAERLSQRGDLLAATTREKEVFEIRAQALGPDFQAAGMIDALRRLATRVAQSTSAPREAYAVAVEAVDLMLLHVPDPGSLRWLRKRLEVRLAEGPAEIASVLGELENAGSDDDPTRFALLAIVQYRLGQEIPARAYLRHARKLAEREEWRADADLSALLEEASATIGRE